IQINKKKILWKAWPHIDTPANGPQEPGTSFRTSQSFQRYRSVGGLLDFDFGQIKRRLDIALGVASAPMQQDVSFLQACSLGIKALLDYLYDDALAQLDDGRVGGAI